MAWLAVHTSKTAVVALLRIAWATVGVIVARVVVAARRQWDPFDNLVRIGIDESGIVPCGLSKRALVLRLSDDNQALDAIDGLEIRKYRPIDQELKT